MAAISCTHCGADLTAPQSVRIAEYQFGRMEKVDEDPGFKYHFEQADNFTILCNSCKRLVRTLPISNSPLTHHEKRPRSGPFFMTRPLTTDGGCEA
jgi:hypothetical protein